jgi:hypothetical protein
MQLTVRHVNQHRQLIRGCREQLCSNPLSAIAASMTCRCSYTSSWSRSPVVLGCMQLLHMLHRTRGQWELILWRYWVRRGPRRIIIIIIMLWGQADVLGPSQCIPPAALKQHVQHIRGLRVHHQGVGLLVVTAGHQQHSTRQDWHKAA